MNDRQLRIVNTGLSEEKGMQPRMDKFDITVASEVMAILCLSTDIVDLKRRLGNIIVGYTKEGKPVTARDLKADGSMTVLLKDALKPNLVQTLEHTPAIIHGGPFANIAHGCNSIAATLFIMWLGERITDNGIGNGISMIIMIGIIARFPYALKAEFVARISEMNGGPIVFIIEIVLMMVIIGLCILLVQGTRRLPVQYAKRVVGNKQYGGVRNYLPLKVNAAGVMPIIFAQAIMFIPLTFVNITTESTSGFWSSFIDYNRFGYNAVFFILIILFTYFYTAITINPQQIAEDLKKNGGFIPGTKPGKQTAELIDTIMSRITLPGSIFLGIVAVLPAIVRMFGVNQQFAQFFGGTSLLIMVGVVLDTLQQIESHLLMRHYDGLTKSGRIKGRMGGVYGG